MAVLFMISFVAMKYATDSISFKFVEDNTCLETLLNRNQILFAYGMIMMKLGIFDELEYVGAAIQQIIFCHNPLSKANSLPTTTVQSSLKLQARL